MMMQDEFDLMVSGKRPAGWTKGHVTLQLRHGTSLCVEAWRRGAFAVHRVRLERGEGRLTHAPSGLQIWTFPTTTDAVELAEKIEGLADWGAIEKKMPRGSALGKRVRNVIKKERIYGRNCRHRRGKGSRVLSRLG